VSQSLYNILGYMIVLNDEFGVTGWYLWVLIWELC